MKRLVASLIVGAALTALIQPAAFAATYWDRDDSCGAYDAYFDPAGPSVNWHIHQGNGFNGCHMWLTTICNKSTCTSVNWASWFLPTSSAYSGNYHLGVWLACDVHFANDQAKYERYANGTGGGVTQTYFVDQSVSTCNQTNYFTNSANFNAPNGGYVRLRDKSPGYPAKVSADYFQYLPV